MHHQYEKSKICDKLRMNAYHRENMQWGWDNSYFIRHTICFHSMTQFYAQLFVHISIIRLHSVMYAVNDNVIVIGIAIILVGPRLRIRIQVVFWALLFTSPRNRESNISSSPNSYNSPKNDPMAQVSKIAQEQPTLNICLFFHKYWRCESTLVVSWCVNKHKFSFMQQSSFITLSVSVTTVCPSFPIISWCGYNLLISCWFEANGRLFWKNKYQEFYNWNKRPSFVQKFAL